MPSRTAYFSKTIFLKNVVRFWPIWAAYLLIWLFVMPVGLWTTMSEPSLGTLGGRSAEAILTAQIFRKGFVTGSSLIAVSGLLAAMGVFSYLFNSRSAGLFHALPVRREGLFITNYISGLSFLIVPNVVIFVVTAVVEAASGYATLGALLSWLGVVSALSLFFYSFGVFCAMFTGHIVALPVFYGALNLVVVGVEIFAKMLLSAFVFGMAHNRNITLGALSPWYQLNTIRTNTDTTILCWDLIIGCALAGAVFAVLALLIYRKRPVESAGDVIAIKPAKPIFKYGAAFCFALLITFILFYGFLSHASIRDSFWRILVCMLLAGFFGYYAADMLLKKSFRVIRSGLLGWLCFSGALVLLLLSMKLDVFGYQGKVPEAPQVKEIYVGNYINLPENGKKPSGFYGFSTEDAGEIGRIAGLHKDIVTSREAIESFNSSVVPVSERDTLSAVSVAMYYIMKDGGTILRSYVLPVTAALLRDAGSPASEFMAIQNTPKNILSRNFPEGLTKYDFENGEIYPGGYGKTVYGTDGRTPVVQLRKSVTLSQDQSYELYRAIIKDIEAGNIGKTYPLLDENYNNTVYAYSISLRFSGRYPGWRSNSGTDYVSGSTLFELEKNSVNTKAALKSMGLLDESQLLTRRQEKDGNSAAVSDVPKEITAFYETYMEALKKSTKEAVQYAHFENGDRGAYEASNDRLIDYRIEKTEKINDNLYAFTVSTASAYARNGKYQTVYNFVGRIDGKLYVMGNLVHIPQGLRDNLDPGKYKYSDPDNLGPGS